MQFKVITDKLTEVEPEPVIELMIRVIDDRAHLCARKQGFEAWTYLLKLGDPDGMRLFLCAGCGELPVKASDGTLRMSSLRAGIGGLPT